jgi:hypothetical protein
MLQPEHLSTANTRPAYASTQPVQVLLLLLLLWRPLLLLLLLLLPAATAAVGCVLQWRQHHATGGAEVHGSMTALGN